MKTLRMLLVLFTVFGILTPQWASASAANPNPGEYHVLKTGGSFVHASTPAGYNPDTMYPLMVGLHYHSGNGSAFLPLIQIDTQKSGWIAGCPDSAGAYTWTFTDPANATIVRRTVRLLQRRFAVDKDRTYLMGHDAGARYILYLMSQRSNVLNDFSGAIISSSEAQTYILNNAWSRFKNRPANKDFPILYLHSTDNADITLQNVQWTLHALREAGYPVHYLQSGDYGSQYPMHLNQVMFEWALSPKTNRDQILGGPAEPGQQEPVEVTNSIRITSLRRHLGRPLVGDDHTVRKNTLEVPGGVYTYRMNFVLREPASPDEIGPDGNENIQIELCTYDKNYQPVHRETTSFIGLEAGLQMSRDYIRNRYGVQHAERDQQVETKNRLRIGEHVLMELDVPRLPNHKYAVLLIKRGGQWAALETFPRQTDHRLFPDLKHLSVPGRVIEERPAPPAPVAPEKKTPEPRDSWPVFVPLT